MAGTLLSVAFTNLVGSPLAQAKPLRGIFTSVCDASQLTTDQPGSHDQHQHQQLQDLVAGASVLAVLVTRTDSPSRTEAALRQMLAAAPPGLRVPLLVLTTAPDLDQGVQEWLHTLPGMVLKQSSGNLQCLQCL